jgi:hypothetical protein
MARVIGIKALARHVRGRHVTVGPRAQEQLAVLDDQQLLSRLGRNRRRALKLYRTRASGDLEVLALRAAHLSIGNTAVSDGRN